MKKISEYSDSFLERLRVVGSSDITPENSEKYWLEHKAGMTWGIQKALGECWYPRDVAILGAGRCNDIRLLEVMQKGSIENIDLYDLDADSLHVAINDVKAKINTLMPEAVTFANFNPVLADVTFVMRELVSRFDKIRRIFQTDLIYMGENKQTRLYWAILEAIHDTLRKREIPNLRYDTVVSDCVLSQILVAIEMQVDCLRDELLSKSEISFELWNRMTELIHEIFVEDHIAILRNFTRPGGTIFIASDTILLLRGKVHKNHAGMLYSMHGKGELPGNENIRDFGGDYVVEELEIPRIKYMDGDLLKIVSKCSPPGLSIVASKEWEWNRNPHELQNDNSVFGAEKVQGVVLKRRE